MSASSLRLLRDLNVVIAHPDDAVCQSALTALDELVRAEAINPLISAWFSDDAPEQARVLGTDNTESHLTELLAEIQHLERIRIVGLYSPLAGLDLAPQMSRAVDQARELVRATKSQLTEVTELRIQAATVDRPALARGAFAGSAHANIALIPHDRFSDTAAARLGGSDQPDRLASHVAVELCSVLGAWTTMDGSPFDNWTTGTVADDGLPVVFVRSLVRSLVCPPLPLDRIAEDGALPVPQGFLPSPNPAVTVKSVVDTVFPDDLKFADPAQPVFHQEMSLGEAIRLIPRRFVSVLKSLPRVYREGISRDLESLQGDGLQELIGGEAAWLQITFRDRRQGVDQQDWESIASDAIADLEAADEMASIIRLPDDVWARLIRLPLSVADGSKLAEEARGIAGERRYLVADPVAFAGPSAPSSEAAISNFLTALESSSSGAPPPSEDVEVEDPAHSIDHDTDLDHADSDDSDDAPENTDDTDLDHADSDDSDDAPENTDDTELDHADSDDESDPVTPQLPEQSYQSILEELGTRQGDENQPAGLLGLLNIRILNEKRKADLHLSNQVAEMLRLVDESAEDGTTHRVPLLAQIAMAVSAFLAVFALCVFTPLSNITDLAWLGTYPKVVLWFIVSAGILGFSWFLMAKSEESRYTLLAVSLGLFVLALAVTFAPGIRRADFVRRSIGSDSWMIWPSTVVTCVTGFLATSGIRRQAGAWRSSYARFLRWGTVGFLTALVIIGSSAAISSFQPENRYRDLVADRYVSSVQEETPEAIGDPATVANECTLRGDDNCGTTRSDQLFDGAQNRLDRHFAIVSHFSQGTRLKLLVTLLLVALIGGALGVGQITLTWVRIEFRNRNRGRRFRYAQDEALRASRTRRRLQFFLTQWLGTASALSRIVWRPLGEVAATDKQDHKVLSVARDLHKLQIAELELSRQGEEILLVQLRSLLVRPGWLTEQYRRAAQAYVADDPAVIAAGLDRSEWPRPETCPSTPALEDAISGRASGLRWAFTRSLYDGSLDATLQERLADYTPAEIYRSLLDSQHAASVELLSEETLANASDSPRAFFSAVLPAAQPRLPTGIVEFAFVANDDQRAMQSYLCWPEDLMPDTETECVPVAASPTTGVRGAVITAVRCDVSRTFSTNNLQLLDAVERVPEDMVRIIDEGL